jgi:integrase
MRIRESFSLYKRRLGSGAVVFYYQTYTRDGKRTCGYSTGKSSRTAAREYCMMLKAEGRLVPEKLYSMPALRDYAAGFWDYESSAYIKSRKARGHLTIGYAKNGKTYTDNQILPYFGDRRLDEITAEDIDLWLTGYEERGVSVGTANNALKVLSVMLGFAVKEKILKYNPCKEVKKLKEESREVKILTAEEAKKMFPAAWSDVWDSYVCYVVNKLAACTGMRIGEILGLRSEYVHEGYIEVARQYSQTAGYSDVKTHKPRNIPVTKVVEDDLRNLIAENGEGYVFACKAGAEKPMGRTTVIEAFFKALERIGINEAERKERNLTFHSWRHFLNTTLLMANVTDTKVMEITGHVTERMKQRYTHFDTNKFNEVRSVQDKLVSAEEAGSVTAGEERGCESVVQEGV